MTEVAGSPLPSWQSFYVIVGSSAAALTGLQFVVMALVAQAERVSTTSEVDTFGTPTIVHFGAVLFVASCLSAPWRTLAGPGLVLAATGLAGLGYAVLVIRRARRQSGYRLVLEDWIWHIVLPIVAYVSMLGAGMAVLRHAADALFVVGAVAVLLLFVGIHNAWDSVAYVAVERLHARRDPPGTP